MTCLWLTLADPDPPTNGQFLYSSGLIYALAAMGMSLTVVGLSRPESPVRQNSRALAWHLAESIPASKWRALVSLLPQVTMRSRTAGIREKFKMCLVSQHWDAIVFDSIAAGWMLDAVLRYCARRNRRPTLVYLSHNHERTVAHHLTERDFSVATRLVKRLDASKVTLLERRLVHEVDLVTANTPEDGATFAAERPGRPVIILPPGYSGERRLQRYISVDTPRRAVVVGSFDWLPKRASLEAFLQVAAEPFTRAGIDLQIVGQAEEDYLVGMRAKFSGVTFTGAVPDVIPYMAQARMALVPDLLGGFKLKALDYVFNRLPIFAMQGAIPGMPLREGTSVRQFASHAELAQGVIAAIDDLDCLNALQDAAFTDCENHFDWAAIGRHLAISMAAATQPMHNPMQARGLPQVVNGSY